MLRAIIFDMDGVICDSEPLHMKAFQQVLTDERIVITDQEYYDKYLAHDDRGSFEAPFNRVELRTVTGVMSHADFHLQVVDQIYQILFEEMLRRGIAPAAIAQPEDRR